MIILMFKKYFGLFGTILRSFNSISKKNRNRIIVLGCCQAVGGALDLIALALVAIIGSLAIRGVQFSEPGNRTKILLSFLELSAKSLQFQIAVLGVLTALLFLLRTALSIFLTRKMLFFLSVKSAEMSSNLISKIFSQTMIELHRFSRQESIYALTTGVNLVTIGLIGSTINLIVDVFLLVFIILALIIIDPIIAVFALSIFLLTGALLIHFLHRKAGRIGQIEAQMNVESNELILNAMGMFREILVRNTQNYYISKLKSLRLQMGNAHAELTFMPNVGKYVIEALFIFGTLILTALQFLTKNSSGAIASLSVFLVAGSRLAPAILRIQQNVLAIKSAASAGLPTLELLERYENLVELPKRTCIGNSHHDFSPNIIVKNLSFKYPSSNTYTLKKLNFEVSVGEFIAIVGPSGAGKSTLVDLILGAITPDEGEILISGVENRLALQLWPGLISYVPQTIAISPGTIRDNLLLGIESSDFSSDAILGILKKVDLLDFVNSLPNKLDSRVGDMGVKMSGGQRQRLGIARALITSPRLLVLDEATSSLDADSEDFISQSFHIMKGSATLLVIAHRLSTVREADRLMYFDNGNLIAEGTFDDVRSIVSDFDRQAKLMGL